MKACFMCLEPLIQNAFLTITVDHKGKEREIESYIMQTTLRFLSQHKRHKCFFAYSLDSTKWYEVALRNLILDW